MNPFPEINFVAVLSAGLAYFFLGAVWYAPPVLGNAWMQELKIKPGDIKKEKMASCLGGSLCAGLLAAFVLAAILRASNAATACLGGTGGLLAGVGFVGTTMLTNYLYEDRSFKLFWINAGYHIAAFVLMGSIIGAIQ